MRQIGRRPISLCCQVANFRHVEGLIVPFDAQARRASDSTLPIDNVLRCLRAHDQNVSMRATVMNWEEMNIRRQRGRLQKRQRETVVGLVLLVWSLVSNSKRIHCISTEESVIIGRRRRLDPKWASHTEFVEEVYNSLHAAVHRLDPLTLYPVLLYTR